MFSSKRFLHYVFAEQTDDYFTRGLLCFHGLQDYLIFLLKAAGYQDTFFISGRKSIQVTTLKEEPLKTGFFGLFSKVELKNQAYSMAMNPDKFWKWMKNRFMKEKHQAFVFYLKEFVSLFSAKDRELYLKECIRLNKEYSGSTGGNIIVLLAGREAADSQPYFIDHEGIFHKKIEDGLRLDSILADITDCDRELLPLYQEMRNQMPDQVYFFNDNKAASVENILKRMQLYHSQYMMSAADRKEMAWMIYYLMHVHSLRRDTGVDYIGPRMTHKELIAVLEKEANWRHLQGKLQELQASYQRMGRSFLTGMKEDYLAHAREQECMIASSLLMNKAREISVDKLNMLPSEKDNFKACIRTMETIWNKATNQEAAAWLLRFLERMHQAEKDGNRDSTRVLVRAVERSVRLLTASSDKITEEHLKNLENFEIWLKECDRLNDLSKQIYDLNQLKKEQEVMEISTDEVENQLSLLCGNAEKIQALLDQTEANLYISSGKIQIRENVPKEEADETADQVEPGLTEEELKELLNPYNF